jgi:hypothetical protein
MKAVVGNAHAELSGECEFAAPANAGDAGPHEMFGLL